MNPDPTHINEWIFYVSSTVFCSLIGVLAGYLWYNKKREKAREAELQREFEKKYGETGPIEMDYLAAKEEALKLLQLHYKGRGMHSRYALDHPHHGVSMVRQVFNNSDVESGNVIQEIHNNLNEKEVIVRPPIKKQA